MRQHPSIGSITPKTLANGAIFSAAMCLASRPNRQISGSWILRFDGLKKKEAMSGRYLVRWSKFLTLTPIQKLAALCFASQP